MSLPPAAASPRSAIAPSLRALMTGLIDYAGLFPPARLPLDVAMRNYIRYRHTEDAWMLGRFICPMARLPELDAFAEDFAAAPPYRFSVLGTGGEDADAFLAAFDADLAARARFHDYHGGHAVAEVIEVRLPPALLARPADTPRFFADLAARLPAADAALELFFELPLTDAATRAALPTVLDAMAAHNVARTAGVLGFKMRCGGLTPEAIPTARQVAEALAACRTAGVRFKATAGLHHPLRHHDDALGAAMHGFFNVFGAALLAHAHMLDIDEISSILTAEQANHFSFKTDTFAFHNWAISADGVRTLRTQLVTSFGSCSFEEPRVDLGTLGLL